MMQFKAPAVIKEWTLPWHYLVKDIRHWYSVNLLQGNLESVLRHFQIWYLVDKEHDKDIKLYLKSDRQLMVLSFIIISIVLLNIWQLISFICWLDPFELLSPV